MVFSFPPWTNKLRAVVAFLKIGALVHITAIVAYGFSPEATDVGYKPVQPIPFSHALHAGELGMDCRYCHTTVEVASHAAVPPTETCMGCHQRIETESPKLQALRDSWTSGNPVPWVRVHDLPDYAYFDHSAHVQSGVGCASCHGRIDKMEEVYQSQTLSMGWCLECHRDPTSHIRPKELITQMDWEPSRLADGTVQAPHEVNPKENCSTCHR